MGVGVDSRIYIFTSFMYCIPSSEIMKSRVDQKVERNETVEKINQLAAGMVLQRSIVKCKVGTGGEMG